MRHSPNLPIQYQQRVGTQIISTTKDTNRVDKTREKPYDIIKNC